MPPLEFQGQISSVCSVTDKSRNCIYQMRSLEDVRNAIPNGSSSGNYSHDCQILSVDRIEWDQINNEIQAIYCMYCGAEIGPTQHYSRRQTTAEQRRVIERARNLRKWSTNGNRWTSFAKK